jgi:hypothetical protein
MIARDQFGHHHVLESSKFWEQIMKLEDKPYRVAPESGQPLIIKIKDVEVSKMNCTASGSVQSA